VADNVRIEPVIAQHSMEERRLAEASANPLSWTQWVHQAGGIGIPCERITATPDREGGSGWVRKKNVFLA
jgi:hypothetical protein